MHRFLLALLVGVLWAQRQADLTILIETSQLTCGRPIEISRQALKVLCQRSDGSVAVGTFSRLRGGRAITWLTTPVQPLNDMDACPGLFDGIKSRCDSIYQVNLLHAIEEAITRGYSSNILVLASGKETGRGLTVGEVRHLAKKKEVRLYFASIGWLINDEATQGFFKQLSGTLEGEEGTFVAIDPASARASERLRDFILQVWHRCQTTEVPTPLRKASTAFPAEAEQPIPLAEDVPRSSKPGWMWIALAGVSVVLVLVLLLVLLKPKATPSASERSAPAMQTAANPVPVAPPAPVLRRLIIYYPHTQQDVNLAPTTAPVTLGRAPDNTIVIADNTVSSHHARLFLQGTQWYVQDLGSTNGTFVNEQRVSQHPVRPGDRIRLGAIVIQIAN